MCPCVPHVVCGDAVYSPLGYSPAGISGSPKCDHEEQAIAIGIALFPTSTSSCTPSHCLRAKAVREHCCIPYSTHEASDMAAGAEVEGCQAA